jgi:hypothetical protein
MCEKEEATVQSVGEQVDWLSKKYDMPMDYAVLLWVQIAMEGRKVRLGHGRHRTAYRRFRHDYKGHRASHRRRRR